MKTLLLLLWFLASAARVPAQTAAAVPGTNTTDPATDREYNAFWDAWRAKPTAGLDRTNRAYWEWQDKVFKQFSEDALAFAQKHPADPRRWEGIVQMGFAPPWFVTGFKPGFDAQPGPSNLIVDEAALAAYKARQFKLDREVILAADATPRQRQGALGWMFAEVQIKARDEGKPADFAQFEPLMDEIAVKLPDERGAGLLAMYLDALRQLAPEQAKSFEAKWADKPVGKAMMELAAKQEQARTEARAALLKATVDFGTNKFIAADGRVVDFAQMRGKVVLIDFWATWCAPCIKEIPNIVTNYAKYHDRGFEVVGITVENAGVSDSDPADDREKQLAASKQRMLAFTKKNNMPWPQYYDGLYFNNPFTAKYGITSIPAMFLLDKDGKVASIEARGPELEKEIKRLLGI